MKIPPAVIGLWLDSYISGSTSERFVKPLEAIGMRVTVVDTSKKGFEKTLFDELRTGQYGYVLHLPYRNYVRHELMKYVSKTFNVVTIAWNGDDEWLLGTQGQWFRDNARAHDFNVTTYPEALDIYEDVRSNAMLAQWGYSESDWKPRKRKKDIDVYFCGGRSPERDFYIRRLLDDGINVDVDGPEYNIHTRNKKLESAQGKLTLKDMINRFQRAKIALNFTKGSRGEFVYYQIKARNFEIPATGTFQLTEWSPDLQRYFNVGEQVACFNDDRELIEKVRYYLENEKEREEIAKNGHERNKAYSYEKIFRKIFGKW